MKRRPAPDLGPLNYWIYEASPGSIAALRVDLEREERLLKQGRLPKAEARRLPIKRRVQKLAEARIWRWRTRQAYDSPRGAL